MRMLIAGLLKRSALAAHHLVSQVVVSVAAAICVAIISSNYFDTRDAALPETRSVAVPPAPITPGPAVASIGSDDTEPKVERTARLPVARPARENEQFARPASPKRPNAGKPFVSERDREIAAYTPPAAPPPASHPHGTEIFSEPAPVAPLLALGSPQPAERDTVLGLPLPRFVPGYESVARSVQGARERVGALVDDLRD